MCAETLWWRCHRRIITDYLLAAGEQVFHILWAGKIEKAIINEVERGEDYLKEKWQAALQSGNLHGETHDLVERLYQSVKQGHDQISQLKHAFEGQANS